MYQSSLPNTVLCWYWDLRPVYQKKRSPSWKHILLNKFVVREPRPFLLIFSTSWTSLRFGVHTTPLDNIFSSGHSVTVTRPNNGNLMVRLLILKPLRLGKYSSSKYFNWLKEISSPASSLPSSVTISVNLLHSAIIISLSCTKLLAVGEGTRQLNPWHSDTLKFPKFLTNTEDGSKFFNLPHLDTWPDVEKDCLVGSFHESWQICNRLGISDSLNTVKCSIVPACCPYLSTSWCAHISSMKECPTYSVLRVEIAQSLSPQRRKPIQFIWRFIKTLF